MLYAHRPAKAIQRAMVMEACRRLSAIASLDSYQYVGFGGLEFNDFVDAHRILGITKMTSIERNEGLVHRLEFNKPYTGMTILMGEARDQLPLVDWTIPAVIWLDYMDALTRNVLRDVEYVTRQALPGSFLIVTLNANLGTSLSDRLEQLRTNLDDLAPTDIEKSDLADWGVADVQRDTLFEQVNMYCSEQHGGGVRQVLDIGYKDVARMQTWAGVLTSPVTARVTDQCRFEDLSFCRPAGTSGLRLRVPDLTLKEWEHLERELGNGKSATYERPKGIERDDVADFSKVYRYRQFIRAHG